MNVLIENGKIICKRKFSAKRLPQQSLKNHCHKFGHSFAVQEPFKTNCSKKQAESTAGCPFLFDKKSDLL